MRQIPTAAASTSQPANMTPIPRGQHLGVSFYHVLVWLLMSTTTWSTSRAFNPLIGQFQDYRSLPVRANGFNLYHTNTWEPSSPWWENKRSKNVEGPFNLQPIASDALLGILKRLAVGSNGKVSSTESQVGHLLTFDQSDDEQLLNVDPSEQGALKDFVKLRKVEKIRKNLRRRHNIGVSGKERRQLAKGKDFLNKLVNLREQWTKRPTHQSRRSKKLTNHRPSSSPSLPGASFGGQNSESDVFADFFFGDRQVSEPKMDDGFISAKHHVIDTAPITAEGFIDVEDRVNDEDLVIFPRRDEINEGNSRGQLFPPTQWLPSREPSQFQGGNWNDERVSSSFFPEITQTQRNDSFSSSFIGLSDFGPAFQSQIEPDVFSNPSNIDGTFDEGGFDTNNHDCETINTKSCSSDESCSCNGMYHCVLGGCALKSTHHPSYTPPGIWGKTIPFD